MMLQLSGSVINPWGCHDTQSVTVVLTLTVVTPTWSVTAVCVKEMIKNIFNLILWLIFIFLLPFYISSEAVHAWDDGSGCSDGSGGSGGRERLESEPGGPERSHVGEVRASDQPWRYTELLLPVMFCVHSGAPALNIKMSLRLCSAESEFRYARWKKAVQKSMNWETTEPVGNGNGMKDRICINIVLLISATSFSFWLVVLFQVKLASSAAPRWASTSWAACWC